MHFEQTADRDPIGRNSVTVCCLLKVCLSLQFAQSTISLYTKKAEL